MKILEVLGDDKYIVHIEPTPPKSEGITPDGFFVAHDYVQFNDSTAIYTEGSTRLPLGSGSTNMLMAKVSIQVPIRDFAYLYLPNLLKNKYLREEHFKDREWSEDDKYFKNCGLTEPRYMKGDKHPPYAYGAGVYSYRNEDNQQMIAFRQVGSSTYSHVTPQIYEQIKGSLNLDEHILTTKAKKKEELNK